MVSAMASKKYMSIDSTKHVVLNSMSAHLFGAKYTVSGAF
jgi:hypothetical protein